MPPTAAFSTTTFDSTANFDATGSSDPEGPISAYSWDYGAGTTPFGTGIQSSHRYAVGGIYNVTLPVTDSANATNSITLPVTVSDPPPPRCSRNPRRSVRTGTRHRRAVT